LFSLSSCPRLHPGPRDPGHPRADTRRVVPTSSALARSRGSGNFVGIVCACTHYLVFKEPAAVPLNRFQGNLLRLLPLASRVNPAFAGPPVPLRGAPTRCRLGEPSKVTTARFPCQPLLLGRPVRLAASPIRRRCGEPFNVICTRRSRQPPGRPFSERARWLLETVGAETKNCSGPAGAILHRLAGGPTPRQKDSIQVLAPGVNPAIRSWAAIGWRHGSGL